MSAQRFIDFDNGTLKSPKREHSGAGFKPDRRKPPQRVTVAPRKQDSGEPREKHPRCCLSVSVRLTTCGNEAIGRQEIGGRVLIPVSDLRQYARFDHPERIAG